MTNETLRIGTFFSGIGSPEKALDRLKKEKIINDYKVEFFSEIDRGAIKSYCAIHDVSENLNLGDITKIKGKNLPYCDLWIGGFPCQDISCAGKMRGFTFESETRSSLGWEMIRLLREVKDKPKYVIFENVASITSKKFKNTLDLFKLDLKKLGYTTYDKVLNAIDFGIPQTRKRYFLVAILGKHSEFNFPVGTPTNKKLKDILDNTVDEKYYYTDDNKKVINNACTLKHKTRDDITYIVDIDKFLNGGVCGKDMHSKFHQSQRLFSQNGYAPTLTASNTVDNAKVVVESEVN